MSSFVQIWDLVVVEVIHLCQMLERPCARGRDRKFGHQHGIHSVLGRQWPGQPPGLVRGGGGSGAGSGGAAAGGLGGGGGVGGAAVTLQPVEREGGAGLDHLRLEPHLRDERRAASGTPLAPGRAADKESAAERPGAGRGERGRIYFSSEARVAASRLSLINF